MKKEINALELTTEQKSEIANWQNKYKVKYLEVGKEIATDTEGKVIVKNTGKKLFFRLPTRQELSVADHLGKTESGEVDPYKKAEKMLVDCLLGGELTLEEILSDIETFMAVANFVLYDLVAVKNVNWGSC